MKYEPSRRSIKKHIIPEWYDDAKFGIFIHWSLSCVPAFAPRDLGDINEILKKEGPGVMFANQPYSEWYLNSLRIEGSPAYEYHRKTYGEGYHYYNFIDDFNRALPRWDPGEWARLFKEACARYVVLVTKHHDGFLLWPSEHPNPHIENCHASRNVVGELTEAVRDRGMRMGYYYSSPLDWTFTSEPIKDLVDMVLSGPADETYIEYVRAHWGELIDRYEPSVLWSDIGYPPGADVNELFAYYYNRVSDGVVNDRWWQASGPLRRLMKTKVGRRISNRLATRLFTGGLTVPTGSVGDYTTPEYTTFSEIKERKWECVRGMGKSFGYNRMEEPDDFMKVPELVRLLVDIVSKNGNLLLNVGPMPGGKIPHVQRDLLLGLGSWLETNGEAIFGTRPWVTAEGKTDAGIKVRFTRKGDCLYAILMDEPGSRWVTVKPVEARPDTAVHLLGYDSELNWEPISGGLKIELPSSLAESPAYAFRLRPL